MHLRHSPLVKPLRYVFHRLRFARCRRAISKSVFIVGCGHTGTSLLFRVLGEHPEVFNPTIETDAFLGRIRWHVLSRLYSDARNSGHTILIEKSPGHIHDVDTIRTTVPGALFIVTTRDGRDVVASLIRRYGDENRAMDRWLKDTSASIRQVGSSDVLLWRYEDFIDNPESSIRNVCRFIGMGFMPAMLEYHQRPKAFFGNSGERPGNGAEGPEHVALRAWQINQPITDTRGRWRQELPADIVSQFLRPPHLPLMEQLGYIERDGSSA